MVYPLLPPSGDPYHGRRVAIQRRLDEIQVMLDSLKVQTDRLGTATAPGTREALIEEAVGLLAQIDLLDDLEDMAENPEDWEDEEDDLEEIEEMLEAIGSEEEDDGEEDGDCAF